MTFRTIKILLALFALTPALFSQELSRSEFAPYALRKGATEGVRSANDSFIEFAPAATASSLGEITRTQLLEVPQSWLDATAYLHLENVGSAYTLSINGVEVIQCEDSFTPTTYNISPYLSVGTNEISITSRSSSLNFLEQGVKGWQGVRFDGSYIFTQNRLRILDYSATIEQVEGGEHGQLLLDVIVQNSFNYPETIEIGFDIYDPAGKLLDFNTATATLQGGAIDTIRFEPYIYGAAKYRWSPDAATGMQIIGRPTTRFSDQPLYKVMLFTKRNRVASDYIPFSVGFTALQYRDGEIYAADKKVSLRGITYNVSGNMEQSQKELSEIKAQGYNTITPSYPQPIWFYSLCDKVGLYVIDQAAINAPQDAANKAVGGTPSNDPQYCDDYLKRMQRMYYRTRNFSCVVGFSLGGESGNGYNMYKAYQWLKQVEQDRPILYIGAGGEWNSDPLTIK